MQISLMQWFTLMAKKNTFIENTFYLFQFCNTYYLLEMLQSHFMI